MVLAVNKIYLALLTGDFFLGLLLVEVLHDRGETRRTGRDNLKAVDLLVTHADFLIEQEDFVFHLLAGSLQIGDVLFEFVATVISSAQLFSPNFLLALIGAKVGAPTRASGIRIVILSR